MSGEREVLETTRRQVARGWAVAAVALLLALLAAAVLDGASRARGAERVAACRQHGASEIAAVSGLLSARTGTVRPTVFALPPGALRQQLLGLVSEAVIGVEDRLQAARVRCEQVRLLWHHGELARRRDACVAELDEQAAWFRAVSRDGSRAFAAGDPDRGCG